MKRSKKGATLVELCVTLVLVAIFMGMFLSFMVSLRKKTDTNAQQEATMQDIERFEAAIRRWILHYDNCDYDFCTANDRNSDYNGSLIGTAPKNNLGTDGMPVLMVRNARNTENTNDDIKAYFYYDHAKKQIVGEMYNVELKDGELVMKENDTLPSIERVTSLTVDVSTIVDVRFDVIEGDSGRLWVRCWVDYELLDSKGKPMPDTYAQLSFTIHSKSIVGS